MDNKSFDRQRLSSRLSILSQSPMCLLFIIAITTLPTVVLSKDKDDCYYNVSGHVLDLSKLAGKNVSYSSKNFTYHYAPCSNDLTCDYKAATNGLSKDSKSCMADQYNSGSCTAYLAVFEPESDAGATYSEEKGEFTLEYSNGEPSLACDSGRNLTITWKCDNDINTLKLTNAQEIDGSTCNYLYSVSSRYACSGGGSNGGGSSGNNTNNGIILGLSIGSVCLIGLGIIIVMYCCIGYILSAKVVNKNEDGETRWLNCRDNIPHLNFWCSRLPKYVWAGCCVSLDTCMGCLRKCQGKSSATNYEHVED